MPTIKIAITEKRATIEGAPIIICGNSDYSIAFTFDSEWASHSTKTARFAYKVGGEFRYEDKIFSGTTCAVPVLIDTDLVAIGVYAGNLRTPTPAAVKCAPSVLCKGKLPADPLPSVYNQLITLINTRTPADAAWHNVTANALKGSASGEVVALTDVSPVEHELGVRALGKNLVSFSGSGEKNGLTYSFTDGAWTITGTPSVAYGGIQSRDITGLLVDGATYTISQSQTFASSAAAGAMYLQVIAEKYDGSQTFVVSAVGARSFTVDKSVYKTYVMSLQAGTALAEVNLTGFTVQLERGASATEHVPYVDPTTITVSRCGKNLLPNESGSYTLNGITFTKQNDGGIKVQGTATATTTNIFTHSAKVTNGATYLYTGCPAGGKTGQTWVLRCYNAKGDDTTIDDTGGGVSFEFKNASGVYNFSIIVFKGATINATFYPMLRLASIQDGSFEPYQCTEHTPAANGTTAGVASLAPTTTLLTDTAGVTIDTTYNRDITKAINALEQALQANT